MLIRPAIPRGLSTLSSPTRSSTPKTEESTPQPSDAQPNDTVELVEVSHQRELRGAWVATVWNLNFPSNTRRTAEQQKQELVAMLERLKECRFNAVFFQVRPEGDALYSSDIEPFSSVLSGRQGQDPGYDPLGFLIEEAHKRNIEVHAWLNPFRARAGSPNYGEGHLALEHPEHVHSYGSYQWMDPGAPEVRQRLVDVCRDLTQRYDIDGLHFDDYFYPYPNGRTFPDWGTYNAYRRGGGTLSRDDWRRQNVNQAIQEVGRAVKQEKAHVRYGVSPFGIPAPDKPEGIHGFDQYEGLFAAPQHWMDEGWVDYLAPQLYWRTDQTRQAYGTLVNWWADHCREGAHIFAGNNLVAHDGRRWDTDEYRQELRLSRQASATSAGNIWWNIGPLMENRGGIADTFKNEFYPSPALPPPLAQTEVSPPTVTAQGGSLKVRAGDAREVKNWTVYRETDEGWRLDRLLPGSDQSFELEEGRWAVAAADRFGSESQGVVVQVPSKALSYSGNR